MPIGNGTVPRRMIPFGERDLWPADLAELSTTIASAIARPRVSLQLTRKWTLTPLRNSLLAAPGERSRLAP